MPECPRCKLLEAIVRKLLAEVVLESLVEEGLTVIEAADKDVKAALALLADSSATEYATVPSAGPEYPGWVRDMRVLSKGEWAIVPDHTVERVYFAVYRDGRLHNRTGTEGEAVAWAERQVDRG